MCVLLDGHWTDSTPIQVECPGGDGKWDVESASFCSDVHATYVNILVRKVDTC